MRYPALSFIVYTAFLPTAYAGVPWNPCDGVQSTCEGPLTPLPDPGLEGGDDFGRSIALRDDVLVVGAYGDDEHPRLLDPQIGAVWIYEPSAMGWQVVQKLTPQDDDYYYQFGYSVDVSDGTIVVGAPGYSTLTSVDIGAVYVFGTRGQSGPLFAPDGVDQDRFGASVAIAGGVLVVGTEWADACLDGSVDDCDSEDLLDDTGRAYVFRHDGAQWALDAVLDQGSTYALADRHDRFGSSVAVSEDGSTIVVGAPGEDAADCDPDLGACEAGSAYVFEHDGTQWGAPTELTSALPGLGDEFGTAVAVSGETVAVGAPLDAVAEDEALGCPDCQQCAPMCGLSCCGDAQQLGAVHVFERDGAAWGSPALVTVADAYPELSADAIDRFGASVALDGDTLLVGSPGDTLVLGEDACLNFADGGAAYLLDRIDGEWQPRARIFPTDLEPGNELAHFAEAVDLFDETIVAGMSTDISSLLTNAGAAYVAHEVVADSCEPTSCTGDLDGNGIVDGADLGVLLAEWGTAGVADLDGSGIVDGGDLGLLLATWGACPA